MSRNTIGFHQQNKKDEPDKEEKSNKVSLNDIISLLYKPEGDVMQRNFYTSAEIAYQLQDMILTSAPAVARTMTEMGFKTKTFENEICFVVYTPESED